MRFGVLGALAVWADDGRVVTVPGAQVRRLLAALLVREGQPVTADRLADDLWGEHPPGNPPAALAVKVSQLRRALDDAEPGSRSSLVSGPAGFALRTSAVDAAEFGALIARAAEQTRPHERAALLDRALGLWRGPAYADHRDEPFAHAVVARLEEQRLTAIDDRAEALLAVGRHAGVADALADVVERHPLRERTRGLRMIALYRSGRQYEALETYADLRNRLADELGVDPGPNLAALHRAILTQDPSLDPPPGRVTHAPVGNLPAAIGGLVGRDGDLADLAATIGAHRLVSLTGVGGVGKTRLATEVAHTMQSSFDDGVWFVELAPLEADRVAIVEAVLRAMSVRDLPAGDSPPLDRLAAVVRARHMLLILDNCEHVIDEAAAVAARLLASAPQARILTTGREPLGIPGEVTWAVPPLDLPGPGDDPATSSAVRLFVARACAAHQGFALEPSNAELVAVLCRRLDGIPLALELAATRIRGLGIQRLVAGLDDRFRLLSHGHRGGPARQQTLTATIDWSWRLLTAPERIVLRRLAVHADGCTPEAADVVCGAGDVAPGDVAGLLGRLVDRSLVVRVDRGDESRYRLLESVAAYSLERLKEADDLTATRRRHLRYHLALAERADSGLRGPDQRRWLLCLDAEAANMRAALDTATADGDAVAALRLVNALSWFSFLRGRLGEARRALRHALAASATSPVTSDHARATAWETGFSFLLGDVADWPRRLDRALGAFDATAAPHERARAAWFLTYAVIDLGDVATAQALADDTLRAFEKADDTWGTAAALTLTAKLAHVRGDSATIGRDAERAATLFRRLGDRWGVLQATEWLAANAALTGDHAAATRLHTEGLDLGRDLGLWADVAGRLAWLGWDAMEAGDHEAAHRRCREALALANQQGAPLLAVFATMGLAWTARRTGDLAGARHLLESLVEVAAHRATPAGRPLHLPSVLVELGHVELSSGNVAAAGSRHREALRIARELGAARDVASALTALACTAVTAGDLHGAAVLLGRAAAAREPTGTALTRSEQYDHDRAVSAARTALGPGFEAAFAAGRVESGHSPI